MENRTPCSQTTLPSIHNGLVPKRLIRVHEDDKDTPILSIPFEVTRKDKLLAEDCVKAFLNGNTAILTYMQNKPRQLKKAEQHHHSLYCAFKTKAAQEFLVQELRCVPVIQFVLGLVPSYKSY